MSAIEQDDKVFGWAVLELMGHRKLAGHVTMDGPLYRIDVYLQDESEAGVKAIATQWYGQAAIYCLTATTKENCLALTRSHQPAPISRWELPEKVAAGSGAPREDFDDVDAVDDDDFGVGGSD